MSNLPVFDVAPSPPRSIRKQEAHAIRLQQSKPTGSGANSKWVREHPMLMEARNADEEKKCPRKSGWVDPAPLVHNKFKGASDEEKSAWPTIK